MVIYIGNTFTVNFLAQNNCTVKFEEISWAEFDDFLAHEFINYMGHEDVARMVGLQQNRITVSAKPGDIVIFTQYKGPRLPEGTTELPEGATIVPIKGTIS